MVTNKVVQCGSLHNNLCKKNFESAKGVEGSARSLKVNFRGNKLAQQIRKCQLMVYLMVQDSPQNALRVSNSDSDFQQVSGEFWAHYTIL